MDVEELPTGGEQQLRAPTTTISTISVHSGDTRLVIALLQSREWLQLKVLEVHPELTRLGASLKEASDLQRAHDEVLLQLQSKQSPVEELLRQADQLISTQKPRAEVYAAMAESLGLAWKDVNSHLEQRKLILDLNVAYQRRAEDCVDRMRALEIACQDPSLPVEIDAVKQLLTKLHDLKRLMLESLMTSLQEGKLLLEKLRELSTEGTLDSRPDHIKTSAEQAVSQVEHWLENLHDRRKLLEIAWQSRKTHLEQCLALALLASDLKGLEEILIIRKEAVTSVSDQMGNSSASAELLLHEHKKLLPEAKELQDRALKVTKATEQLVASGHFAAEQATAQAYSVLNLSTEYLDAIEQRELLLTRAIGFFRSAHTALTKLDQLEVQLTTTKLSASSLQLIQLHSQVSKSLDEMTSAPLQEGYSLLETVCRGSPGIEGVKSTVEEIENRKIHLGELCTAHREENIRLSQAFTAFLEKQNELFSWLVSIAEAFLQGHQDMGSVLAMAKDFLELHHQLLNDLQKKGVEINTLLLTLPPILEFLDDEQREDVDQKVDALHSHWLNLKSLLESRIDLAVIYVKFHSLAVQLANEFDAAEEEFKKSSDGVSEDTIRHVEQKWLSIQQLYSQLTNVGRNFTEDASKVGDPYLDIKRASLCVETLLEHFGNRQLLISDSWQTWQMNITVEREFKVQWEMNVTESTRTVDWVSKLDEQLYPVLTSDTKFSKAIARELEEKLQIVLPEVRRAQAEIELRIKATENLAQKGDTHGQKEAIVARLMELHNKLQVIITDYQILLQMLISFFKNLAELEKTIENLQSQYQFTRLPSAVSEVELLLKEHEASRQAVLELFKFTQNESEQIITRIWQQEPHNTAQHDIQRVTVLLEEKRNAWELAWTERKIQLEQHQQLCQFDSDLHLINSSLNDLSTQLSAIRGQYGESLAGAKATSLAFVYFEKTIELLQLRIQTFVSTADQMLSSEHVSSQHIERELKMLQTRWTAFHSQVVESRRLIDLSIKYFQLVEEAEEWFREGSKLLLTIARKSTTVKLPEEATQLLNEVETFLKPGETRQDERIRQISRLAVELYGEEQSKQVTLVLNENREMMDSFTVISLELSTLAKNLRAAEEQREQQKKEQEEVDASLAAARAEAAAARAAASAAEEARKAAETAAKALQEAAPFLQKLEVVEALPVPPSKHEEGQKSRKSPSPPLKKAKFIDEVPKPIAPVFTVPLHDAVIQEGDRFTFECRVTGFPMPEVTWYKDCIAIQNNPDYQTTFDQGICTLTIEETFTEDSAKFICKAVNAAGTAETNATLSVKEPEPEEQLSPPVFTKRLESSIAREGSTFQMECKVEGNPLPTVQWFKNDVCIDNSPDYVITYNNGEAVLRFEEVFLEDQAEYCCKAANQLGTDLCSAKFTVEPLEPTEAPSFVTPLSNVMARAGQKIKLECEVTGLPMPELNWSHNGKLMQETHDIKMQYDDNKATLVVNEAFPKDAGVYVVSAKNVAGEATSSCNVSVKGRLPTETSDSELASDMEPIKPAIQLPLKDISVFEGKRVRLDCIIIGQPEPEVIWYHNDRPVKESTDFKLLFQGDRCSLIIQEAYLEDAGEYKVVAINSGGEASSKCSLSVKSMGDTDTATRAQLVEVVEPVGMPPKFSKLLTDILAPEGEKVTFESCVNGDPKPDIKWYLNNEEIHDSEKIQLNHDEEGNVSLTILEVSPDNKGVYTVKACNSCGEAKCFANLIVKTISSPEIKHKVMETQEKPIAPAFQELFADRTVNENDTTKFECVITGKPVPKVEWYFNEEIVSGKNFLVSSSGDRHALAIFQTSSDHTGKIACVAENEAGKATCVARLSVRTKSPVEVSTTPHESSIMSEHQESSLFTVKRSVIVQSSSSEVTTSASTINLEPNVQVHSYSSQSEEKFEKIGDKPPLQVQSQQTQELHQQNQDSPVIHEQTVIKVVNGVEGYQETVTTTSSTPVSSPKPTRKSVAPRFVSPLNGKIVDQGADVILDAIVDGYPQPTVIWHKNGQELSPKDGSVIISWECNHARLELKNVTVKDAGRYTCRAANSVGSATNTADVVVKKTIFPPVFGRRLQASVAKVGERVTMTVEVTGTPDPVVTWYKDNQQILGAVPGGPFRTKIQGNSYSLIIEKAAPSHSGKYAVKAENAGGEAQCIADFIVPEPEPQAGMQTEQDLQMRTHVIFKDIKEERIQELLTSAAATTTGSTDTTIQVYKEELVSNLEPFPFNAEPPQPRVKHVIGPPPPSPSKFLKGEFRESDYESDYDSKIPAKWRPYDSDADEPSYKPVKPVLTPSGRRIPSQASTEVRTPTPPTEFDNPPQFGGPPRPKFEPIEKPSPPVKLEVRIPDKPQKVFKPTPVTPKPPSPVELIVATPAIKEPDVILQPGTPPELKYAPPPPRIVPCQNATQMETSKVMKFAESTQHSHRVVSVQQTTRVIKFGDNEKKIAPEQKLEPFPFKPEPERQRRRSGPPPTTPKKFMPGEFRESDYESDYEGARIKPRWTPGNSDTDEPHYRKVRPPPVTRSTSVPAKPTDSIPTPMEFDTEPVVLPSPVKVTEQPKTKSVKLESEQKRLKRVEEMRNRFSESTSSSLQKKITAATKSHASVGDSQQILLQPGEPPEFGFVPASTSYVASKHMSEMTDTFKSKAQQFVDDIMTDVKSTKESSHVEKPKGLTLPDENDPQAYREESRLAEYGTKHIDPDTGLIYFKYDFGYEFGIILPGEGDKKPKHAQIEKKRDDDIEVPIIHETSGSEKKKGPQPSADSGKVPQFRPKKFSHLKAVKWEPMSESEMSEAEGDSIHQHKKRYSLPQSQSGGFQKAPHIFIPHSSRWDQASPSPLSLSPSLPSLSPHYSGQGPHGTASGVDSTASPGGSWQGLSPNRGPRSQGRGSTPTPPSTPSTPGSTHGSAGNLPQPRKPPTFITPLRDIAVVSGQNARFECIVQAEPPPNILWSKNGRIIENSQNYQIQYRNGVCRLTIPQAFPEDAGSYTCTATNMLGTIGTTGSLQVPGIPSHITYGTYRQLQSELQPSRDWMTSVSSLMTDAAELEDMVQEVVVQQSPSEITVGGRPGDVSPPIFEQIFRNARFAQGGNALFEGRVRGKPKPIVSWTRKGAPLIESNKYKMKYEEGTGNVSLLINHIGPGDEGEYTCTARNQYGEAICSVYIQPEGAGQLVQQGGYQKEYEQVYETSEQRISGTQTQSSFQSFQQTTGKTSYTNGHIVEEDFKVDTFEYRLLREVEFRESLTRRYVGETDAQIVTTVDRSLGPVVPPQIAQKPRNSKLAEGSDAVFQARVSANPRPRLTWFKNGQRIVQSQKYRTSFSNQQATLNIVNAHSEDSGHYTLLAENPQGCVVSSAYLAIEPSAVQDGFYDSQKVSTLKSSQVESTTVVDSSDGKTLAPNFVRVCADREASEGKMTRFDCRVTGRPYPEVHWFINGRQVSDDATHKILVNESGNHALMITNVSRTDAGIVSCIARNKSGETSFQCNLNVIEKEQVVAPKFVERFTTVHVKEGEPVVLNARAVGTPIPRITWQKDGVPVVSGPDVHITIDSGASTLDISRAKASDAAWYQCTAQNVAGSTATRARLFVETPKGSAPEPRRLNLPRPTKVIEPELAPGPEVIYLRHVERAKPHVPQAEEDRIYPPPQFIIPLHDISQIEGGRVHFEARIEPVGDPTMRVDWFVNGRPLEASSRATTTFRFGFIALDLISIILEDSGEYVCRVTSQSGCVESQGLLSVTGRAAIEQSSQYPDSLQYIQQLEDYSRYQRTESVDETSSQRPLFIRPLQDLGELQEGRNAHFEAQLTPVSDPTMKVEWYKDGRPITASSRITTIFNFGYVSLNILHLRVEDAGTYTVRAVNHLGEAISTSTLRVYARSSVTGDLGIPEQQRYIEKVEELEAYQQQQQYRYVQEVPESTAPPEFKSPIKDQTNIREGAFAHFEARLEPISDSTLQVEWLKDGRPVEASSRITTFFNFGYVALTIKHVTTHDIGVYTCRAYNRLGQASTSAQLTVVSKKDIILDSQHPGGLEKIQYLEDASRYSRSVQEESAVTQKPRFLGPLKGTNKIVEGQRAHFEVRVEPQNDMTLQIEWYFNGRVIQSANRIQTYHDFGYIAIDILSVRSEDAGTYTVVARNALGEAQLSATMEVEVRSSIDTTSMHRSAMEKTQRLEGSKFVEPQYHIEEISKSKPIFVQPLSDPKPVNEGKNIHLECRLEPMGDPTMRVEWFYNGRPVTVGSRFRTYYDFGFVALDIIHATSLDSGEYTVRATNHLGSAHTSACVRVIGKSDILTDSQNEAALEQIQMLEDSSRYRKHVTDDITIVQPPQFTRPLHNMETVEGTNVHLECRLQPVGDPTMRVDWFVNGRPVATGHRFRPAYDFDYVALDLLSVYPVDSGVYTCQARNQLGEAVTSCSVRVIAKKDLILDSQHPSGFEKIQYLEDTSRYKKSEYIDEVVNIKPRFLTKPKSLENMREGQHAHFECKLEPVTDSNLKVEWYKNGRPITVGHRFRPIHDFGYVALDIIDLIAEDSGTYTCRAVNLVGADETTCTLICRSSAQILTGTQNETGLEQIQYLEDRSRYQRSEFIEETTKQAPIFTTSLKHIDIKEGQRAHFECRLIPVSDPTMKVEWFHNNVPVKSGSRFTETNNFGFVALDILYCYPEDSGTYTCRAKNIIGEAVTSANLVVHSKKSIYLESQHESALNRISYLEDSSRYQRQTVQEETVTQAPVFTQPMRDIRVAENQAVHFEARLIPVGDPKLKVEWLRNGVPIEASNRVTTMHDFGYVALNMKYVYPEDSGTYTCRATNELGEAVTSSTLIVHSKASLLLESQHEGALQKLHLLEDSSRYSRREEEEIVVTQAPHFTAQLNGPTNLLEGQSAHYECRIEPYPDPNLKVEWFHNGKPLQTGHRFRTTYDFGFAALDILSVYPEDSGEYTCKATNKLGTATSSIKLNVKSRSSIILDTQHEGALQKIQYLEDDSRYKRTRTEEAVIAEKPQFGRPLRNVEHLPEGLNVHLEATLTPVNDPTMKVEWYCNGRPIPQGHRFKTTYDFGFVALDILYAYAEDSGTYMCKAKNAVGEAVTTCSVQVEAKAGLYLDTLDAQRLKKIRDLEAYERPSKAEVEPQAQKPVFITPLNSLENLKEGDHAHLECRVEPINDPNLKIEWFVNGVAIKTGHRFRTTHDFGYVALDVLYTYADDSGTYMAKATNLLGEAVNTCQITVGARRSIYLESQHPEGLAKIRELEAQGRPARLEVDEPVATPPHFITELRGTTDLFEGQTAHFEAQVEPLHDPNLRIEFYHNGKPLPSASRFHITFDFGYVALDITHVVPEDAGEYTVKAINNLGQCTSSISLRVQAKGNIILESQRPEGLEKIRQLEGATPFQRPEVQEPQTRQRPVFTQPLQNIDAIAEGQTAHFECRLIPVGDPTLKVEWFRNEKPLETSSRITRTHDFGFVALDMTHVRGEDEGVYICRASNALGEAVTTASMKIRTKASIQLETQHPEGMKKIKQLEEGRAPARPDEPDRAFEKPIFTQLLTGPSELWEGQHAHFECRVVPVGDPSLRFEWFVNGIELKMGSRFHVTHDFGFVTLDIHSVVTEDSGVYMCKAINNAGEAVSSTSLKVKSRSSIVGEPLQPDAWQKIQLKEAEMNKVPEMFVDTTPQQAPVFTTHLVSHDKLVEGQHVMLEAQVEPRADPNLRIEWFKNGVSLTTGTRLRSTFDFGLVTLVVNGLRADDSAIYTCKATNLLGEAVSTCTLKVEDRHWLLGGSLRPEALPIIEGLEAPKGGQIEVPEPVYESPVFITHLNNVECKEGDAVHFECHVEPSKDPTLNIEWFVNGKPLPSGARFKSTYDFGYVSLDINHAYAEDSGIYMCKATNNKGQAQTSGTLRCISKADIYLDTQHPQGKAGFEKVKEAEDAYLSKYQRRMSGPDTAYPKPVFTTPLEPKFSLGEAEPLHLECTVEPKEDPNLKVEWYFNGKALEHGSRFKMTCDFGYVTLHLTDVYERDQGIYTCKAYNLAGEAFTSTTVYCTGKEGLIEHTQHPKGAEGLEKIQNLEESLRRQEGALPEGEEGHPPVFTSQFQNLSNLSEGDIAHFEASLTPVGDQTMVVEWFYKGEVLKASHRTRTVHAFGMVVLEILGTKIEDSGTYTCRATNKWGRSEISVELECVEKLKGQKPQFTSHIQSLEGLKDGDSVHFECTLIPVGDPNLKVEWFHNGQPIRHSSRMKSVSDFGFVVMDISYIQSHDSGEYVCKASNRYGEDFTRATVKCAGKGGVYLDSLQPDSLARIRELEVGQGGQPQAPTTPVLEPPKFITQISNVTQLVEGQSAHFEARLTPVNDPNLTVEWYYNGKKLPHGHRYRTFHDFGIVILDILYCYEENSGEYECRAVNKVGQDSTKATLKCVSKANLILESQLPRGMEGGLEKIQNLEDSLIRTRDERSTESRGQAPVFTVPLSNIDSLREGENAHFEARLTPTDDPKLKVEWFWNGRPLKTGSRFRTFCDFGFVILEISPVYPEDSGEYSCRAFNDYGQAVTTANMKVQGKRSIILESQLPKGMERTIEKIAELEGLGAIPGQTSPEEDSGKPPEFITTPVDLTLTENSLAHFECQLTPVNDSSMRVEWYHNGKPLSAGSRIKTINDFGFVILEVAGVYQRDSGLYTCKATNRHGEATVSCKLQVRGRQGIIMEPQLPSNFRTGTESIQKLEEALYKRDEILSEEEKPDPPRFIVELKDIVDVPEGGAIHFECRVEPVGDSTMRIDWFHNGRPFATGSRVHMLNDFGFIVLDMDYTYARDSGEYICRATNKWGSATTKATLTCTAKRDIVLDSQLPQGMSGEKLKELERGPVSHALPEEAPLSPPKFITQIESVGIGEGEPVHLECRVEPKTDPKLRVEWYRNSKPLPTGHRFRTLYDMGFVSLDILYTYPEDSGEYICRAVNDLGEDTTRATISCKQLPTIILQNQVPKGMKKSEALMQMEATIKKYTSEIFLTEDDLYDIEKKQPPRFVTQIQDQTSLVEMQSTKFECQLAPVGDPNMKVEWFFNGKPLPHKNRFTPIYDFGYVAMNFGWVYPEDSGEYLCRATNLYGMDETRAIIKTAGKPGIIYESQLPKGMKSIERIREMEAAWQVVPEEATEELKPKQAPAFVTKPEPFAVTEGEMARFCCRVTGHPKPRVMWIVNGHTVVNGTRYKLTYDGMWHLDIPKTRQYDHGKVEVIARNSAGEAVAVTDLTVKPRQDDYRNVLKNSPRPWYDYELTQYQKERQETELERIFEERNASSQQLEIGEHLGKQKIIKEPETEWQQTLKKKKGEEYYSKLKELEDEQVVKETRLREASHQFAIPGEKVIHKSLAKGMAQSYEEKLDKQEEVLASPQPVIRTAGKAVDSESVTDTSETSIDSRKVTGVPPEPSESAIHGREVHVAKQKQTQKEVKGDLEITRKITATETTEVEHKARTQERVVQGQVKPTKSPFFTKKIQPCRAFEQSQARFEVEFDGDPLPTIKWFREDFPIQSSADLQIHTFSTKSILIVRQVFMEDSGVFSVVAENRGGSAKCSANLVVEERRRHGRGGVIPPSFLTTVQDTTVAVGQLARFDARVTGTKPLDVYWLKNGKKITSDIRYKTLEEDNTYTLLIIEAFPEDSGKYECVAINSAGEARCDAQCLVQQPSSTPSKAQPSKPITPGTEQAPSVVEPLKGQVIREGQAVAFRCKISGRPVPDIKWLKGDKVIKPSKYFQMQKDGDVYTLRISEAFPEDEGVYKCIATNPAGDVTLSADLRVLAPDTQEVTPSLSPMNDVIVSEGSPAQFRTQVSGKPQPTIQWLRDGLLIPQSADFQMIHEGTNVVLLIATTYEEDSGTFTCRATNSAGQVETSAQLIVKSKN